MVTFHIFVRNLKSNKSFGRKPTGELTVSNNSMEKENREPEVVILSRAQLIKNYIQVKMRETALSCRASSVGGARPHSQRSLPRLSNILYGVRRSILF